MGSASTATLESPSPWPLPLKSVESWLRSLLRQGSWVVWVEPIRRRRWLTKKLWWRRRLILVIPAPASPSLPVHLRARAWTSSPSSTSHRDDLSKASLLLRSPEKFSELQLPRRPTPDVSLAHRKAILRVEGLGLPEVPPHPHQALPLVSPNPSPLQGSRFWETPQLAPEIVDLFFPLSYRVTGGWWSGLGLGPGPPSTRTCPLPRSQLSTSPPTE